MNYTSLLLPFLFFLISLTATKLQGQSTRAHMIEVKKTQNFALTGKGTAENWAAAEWISLRERNKKKDFPKMETRIKLLYSNTGIYFLFECKDQILNATMKSDFMKLWKEDVVEVFLWPDQNLPAYFEYEISPLNYELPILVSNVEGDLVRWIPYMYESDRITRHKTSVEGGEKKSGASIDSWTAEFFIPFKLLRPLTNNPPGSGTRWSANFYRVDYDNEQKSFVWRPVRDSFHEIEKFGTIFFE